MKKSSLLSVLLAVLVALAIIVGAAYALKGLVSKNAEEDQAEQLVGNDQDEHGCIGSAGYQWCQLKQRCLRIWEESCDEAVTAAIQQLFADKYDKMPADIKVVIARQTENHLRGSVQFAMNGEFGEGGIVLAAKVNNSWQLVFDGNGGMACSLVRQYDFPAEMIEDCYED